MTQSLSEHRAMLSMIRESLISTVQASLPSSDLSGLADRWMAYEDDYVVKSARYSGGRLSGYEVDFGVHALTVNIYYGALDGRVSYYRLETTSGDIVVTLSYNNLSEPSVASITIEPAEN